MNERFEKILARHKKLVAQLGNAMKKELTTNELRKLMTPINKTAKELTLVNADFKCEKTGKKIGRASCRERV